MCSPSVRVCVWGGGESGRESGSGDSVRVCQRACLSDTEVGEAAGSKPPACPHATTKRADPSSMRWGGVEGCGGGGGGG